MSEANEKRCIASEIILDLFNASEVDQLRVLKMTMDTAWERLPEKQAVETNEAKLVKGIAAAEYICAAMKVIALRNGEETDWPAFRAALADALVIIHSAQSRT